VSRGFLFAFTLTLLAGCQGTPESTVVVGTGGYKVERLFTVDGCTAYRFNDGRTVHFVQCGHTVQTSWQENCGKNCVRTASVSTDSGVLADNTKPRGDGLRMESAANNPEGAAVTPAAPPLSEMQP
jgi:hypothetical protein